MMIDPCPTCDETPGHIRCARELCSAELRVEPVDGVDVILIVAEREGWLALTSGYYCPCCRGPSCPHFDVGIAITLA